MPAPTPITTHSTSRSGLLHRTEHRLAARPVRRRRRAGRRHLRRHHLRRRRHLLRHHHHGHRRRRHRRRHRPYERHAGQQRDHPWCHDACRCLRWHGECHALRRHLQSRHVSGGDHGLKRRRHESPVGDLHGQRRDHVGPRDRGDPRHRLGHRERPDPSLPFAPVSGNGLGQTVATRGVIVQLVLSRTATGARNYGFFLQEPAGATDGDPTTSDGIFVFMAVHDA